MQKTGAQILVQSLIDLGVEVVFGYPGGAVLNIYDALYEKEEELTHILTSHEQGAAHAADGYARSTGKTGVVIATSGPGATNLVTGIATAFHDSVPLVAITGNVTRDLIGRDSFQEVDIVNITSAVVKHNFFVRDVESLQDIIYQAFEIANSGRKGPVLIDIPKDVTALKAEYEPREIPKHKETQKPSDASIADAAQAIMASKKPIIYCGGGVTFSDSGKELLAFARKIQAPICQSMMGISALPANDALTLGLVGMHGTPTANLAVSECDLLITVGARFSDRVAGDRSKFANKAKIIHIDVDNAEISKNIYADFPVVGNAKDAIAMLSDAVDAADHGEWIHYLLQNKVYNGLPEPTSERDVINPRHVLTMLGDMVNKENTIIATDVGQHQMYVAQYYPFMKPRTFLSSCGLGTMGYGMGAANGAAVGNPKEQVVLITGDGSFHMNLTELAVAVSNNLKVIVIVMNNSVLGMVHQWQSLFYNERYSNTEIDRQTDFKKLAEAFGAKGLRMTKREEIRPVLAEALAHGGPCVIDCWIDHRERVFPIIPPGGNEKDMIFTE